MRLILKFRVIFCILIFILFVSCKSSENHSESKTLEAMDTVFRILVFGQNSKKAVGDSVVKINELEKTFSVTDVESQIYGINHRTEPSVLISDDVKQVLDVSLRVAENSKGVFNPFMYPVTFAWGFTSGNYRIPADEEIKELLELTDYKDVLIDGNSLILKSGMMLDFGAVAKGYAGDQVISVLKQNGIKSALLDFGGNVQALGSKVDGSSWKIGIRCPWNEGVAAGLEIVDQAAITSGGYIRYFIGQDGKKYIHIFDGKTGRPAETDLLSVTIVCKSGSYGDALSTACFIMGKNGAIDFWRANKDFEMVLITQDHSIYYTGNLCERLQVIEEFHNIEVIE